MHEALMLWRDAPLPELRTEPFSTAAVAQLEQLRLAALEERIDADLALGRETALVTELESLIAEHPYRERLRAQLMLALYRSGRQADALDAYQAGRRVLQEDLDPSPARSCGNSRLRSLRQDETLTPARPVAPAEPEQPPSSRRLSRRAVVAASLGGVAAVALGVGRRVSLESVRRRPCPTLSVGVVDPVARQVVDDIPVEFSSALIAAGVGAVWLLDPNGSTLTKIDPETNDVVSRFGIQRPGVPTGLAAGEGSVWISSSRPRSQRARRPRNWRTASTHSLAAERERVFPVNFASVPLTVGEGAVWALERGLGQVTRIQPATGRHERFAEGVGHVVDRSRRECRLAGGTSGVTKVDLDTGRTLEHDADAGAESVITSIDVGPDAVWFVGDSSAALAHRSAARVDPGHRSDRGDAQSGGRRGRRGRVGRERLGDVALAGGSRDERPRSSRPRSDLGRRRRPLRQDLDEPWSISW